MSVENKKMLSVIVYYTLAGLALLSAGFFLYCLAVKDVAMWARVIYYIWTGVLIANVVYDVICTNSGEGKQISGIITYVLSVLAVIMACILYVINSGATGLATDFFNLFLSVSLISLMATGYLIATWCVGENLVEHTTAEEEIQSRE